MMSPVALGSLSAASFGIADFIAGRNSRRMGAALALAGMLGVGAAALSLFMLAASGFDGLFATMRVRPVLSGCLHGVAMALALLLFFAIRCATGELSFS